MGLRLLVVMQVWDLQVCGLCLCHVGFGSLGVKLSDLLSRVHLCPNVPMVIRVLALNPHTEILFTLFYVLPYATLNPNNLLSTRILRRSRNTSAPGETLTSYNPSNYEQPTSFRCECYLHVYDCSCSSVRPWTVRCAQ